MKDPSLLDASVRNYAHYPGGHPEGYSEGPMNLFTNVYRRTATGDSVVLDIRIRGCAGQGNTAA